MANAPVEEFTQEEKQHLQKIEPLLNKLTYSELVAVAGMFIVKKQLHNAKQMITAIINGRGK
ncbi:MAG: hypothetical protein A2499_04935 [Stygiobacter sp. RIFOXYC12_FULL_38_8]|nr:MAG: hypothetical protein A2299_16305 [Stygiobacter sp. RIFOXYB2_FULL_37_11]OGV13470.1 MAG: hypothetical protein A2237_17000 [Stygiobacter sp. RIFOXYA2_FULL_38_8]OGV14761.1 MAG: hypothetical protein A2440_09685 [Stygiobacter sp. RIFOXYC2_FULL_38_25]OGV22297.1 MAG: hypothetical protein A2499_04935 [Stygiobacter sp. RIFOXYC12_FULL_38_8]OGV79254.1 MAG: hypothetical protein A2X65_02055 [Stygiobacter sp. GWF2_38_21]